MEVKRTQSPATPVTEEAFSGRKARDLVSEIKGELQKVTWTDKEELKAYTQIVVLATFFFGMGIYIVDLSIQGFLAGLGLLIRFIGG